MTVVELQSAGGDALAREIALLSQVLAEVLAEQEGPQFARAVARLRHAAEERERVRRRRAYDAHAGRVQRESLAEVAARLRGDEGALRAVLEDLDVAFVLTAHPTEATRRSILDHERAMWQDLDADVDGLLGPSERAAARVRLRERLTLWWQTDSVRHERPRVEDEVERTLFVVEDVLFGAVGVIAEELERQFVRPAASSPPAVRFGSWAGGDMDGNPFVGAESLERTLEMQRQIALRCCWSASASSRAPTRRLRAGRVRVTRRARRRPRGRPAVRGLADGRARRHPAAARAGADVRLPSRPARRPPVLRRAAGRGREPRG